VSPFAVPFPLPPLPRSVRASCLSRLFRRCSFALPLHLSALLTHTHAAVLHISTLVGPEHVQQRRLLFAFLFRP
jgi:hypothetical protein